MLARLGVVHLQLLHLLELKSTDPGLFLLRRVLVVDMPDSPAFVFYVTSDFDLQTSMVYKGFIVKMSVIIT
jgi:hypothetical protein